MGSKRSKKQETAVSPNQDINTVKMEEVEETDSGSSKSQKRKKKINGNEGAPRKIKKTNKRDVVSEDEDCHEELSPENPIEAIGIRKDITWPDEDIAQLIRRMETTLPEKDVLTYKSRLEKLDWEGISFKEYDGEDCKATWLQLQKHLRKFRLLGEILKEAKDWTQFPIQKTSRTKRHPDKPKRPLSSYLLYYQDHKEEFLKTNPNIEPGEMHKAMGSCYKNLSPEQRETYDKTAATQKQEYVENLRIFFEKHPEFQPPPKAKVEKDSGKQTESEKSSSSKGKRPTPTTSKSRVKTEKEKIIDTRPKKCQTPFGLYFESEFSNSESGIDRAAFKEKCKDAYKEMGDKDKAHWISLSEHDLDRYQREVINYKHKHPEYEAPEIKSILTKHEKCVKERAAGKPPKPPNSAYALYSKLYLQSDLIKSVHPKDRMNVIALKWKAVCEEEKAMYKDRLTVLMQEYQKNYKGYVNSLPEEQREAYEQSKKTKLDKRKSKPSSSETATVGEDRTNKSKFSEPEQPPISAYKYFVSIHKGEGSPLQLWKSLSAEDKRKYEDELVKKKQAYIIKFEEFLKSLSKEELEAFSKTRQQAKSDDSSDCSSDSDGDISDSREEINEAVHDSESE